MRVEKLALRYAILSSQRPSQEKHWRADTDDARIMTDEAFAHHVNALCAVARDVRNTGIRGMRTASQIKERVAKRESEWTRRTALDLQRIADLEDRMSLRHAEAARRRWFVLGRLLSRAAEEDAYWREVLRFLVDRAPLTAQEQRALSDKKTSP